MTKFQLMDLFFHRGVGNFISSGGTKYKGIISGIQHEDGSGRSFIILLMGGEKFHMRTID